MDIKLQPNITGTNVNLVRGATQADLTNAVNNSKSYRDESEAFSIVSENKSIVATDSANSAYSSATTALTYRNEAESFASSVNPSNIVHIAGTETITGDKTFSGTILLPSTTSIGTITSTELGYVDGVTSSIQTQLDNKVVKVTSTDNAIVIFDGTTGNVQNSTILIDDNGNLNITGTGKRITGDFSNATAINRVAFQTSATNSNTIFEVIPNGTATGCALLIESDSALTNGAYLQLTIDTLSSSIRSGIRGTGTYTPMTFYTGGLERMRIDTNGNVLVTGSGGLGYGTGSGGTVTQLTSKSTAVTLNKPTGQIIMNNAALAAGAVVQFNILNSLVATTDSIKITLRQSSSIVPVLIELTYAVENGLVQVGVRNNHTAALGEALVLNFAIIKGANS